MTKCVKTAPGIAAAGRLLQGGTMSQNIAKLTVSLLLCFAAGNYASAQSLQRTFDSILLAALPSCGACESNRRSCFANCNRAGPAGGQTGCAKQCYKTYTCVPKRDCQP